MASEIENKIYEQFTTLTGIKNDIRSAINTKSGEDDYVSDKDSFFSYAEKIHELKPPKASGTTTAYITSNGNHTPDGDYAAFSEVTVKVDTRGSGGGGGGGGGGEGYDEEEIYDPTLPTFKVRFMSEDGKEELQVVEVEQGQNAEFTGTNPTKKGYIFMNAWNPAPISVESDMTCYPIFKLDSTEIYDSWEKIIEHEQSGEGHTVGHYKTLVFGPVPVVSSFDVSSTQITFTVYNSYIRANFQKVATKESGSNSTWITYDLMPTAFKIRKASTNGSYTSYIVLPYYFLTDRVMQILKEHKTKYANSREAVTYTITNEEDGYMNRMGWIIDSSQKYESTKLNCLASYDKSSIRQYLTEFVYPALPSYLKNAIIEVDKKSTTVDSKGFVTTSLVTSEKVWIPSVAEINGSTANYGSVEHSYYNSRFHDKGGDVCLRDANVDSDGSAYKYCKGWFYNSYQGHSVLNSPQLSYRQALCIGFCI